MLGIEAGNFVQVLAATAGLAAVVASSAAAFSIVKYAGAAYLVVLDPGAPRGRHSALGVDPAPGPIGAVHRGPAGGHAEPEVGDLPARVLPQLIDPGVGPVRLQTLVLGSLFNVIAMAGDMFALAAGTAGAGLRARLASPAP